MYFYSQFDYPTSPHASDWMGFKAPIPTQSWGLCQQHVVHPLTPLTLRGHPPTTTPLALLQPTCAAVGTSPPCSCQGHEQDALKGFKTLPGSAEVSGNFLITDSNLDILACSHLKLISTSKYIYTHTYIHTLQAGGVQSPWQLSASQLLPWNLSKQTQITPWQPYSKRNETIFLFLNSADQKLGFKAQHQVQSHAVLSSKTV